MTDVVKISLPFVDLECNKVLEPGSHFAELHEKYLRWVYIAKVDWKEDADMVLFEERNMHYDWRINRRAFTNLELNRTVNNPGLWNVTAQIWGSNDDLRIYFKKQANAEAFFEQMHEYIFG